MGRIGTMLSAVLAGLAVLAPAGPAAAREGQFCGGIAGRPCEAGEICAYLPGLCPTVVKDASGVCRRAVAACEPGGPAVCGCDGRTYPNACEAEKARAFVKRMGACG